MRVRSLTSMMEMGVRRVISSNICFGTLNALRSEWLIKMSTEILWSTFLSFVCVEKFAISAEISA